MAKFAIDVLTGKQYVLSGNLGGGDPGPQGPQGDQGSEGPTGPQGAFAEVDDQLLSGSTNPVQNNTIFVALANKPNIVNNSFTSIHPVTQVEYDALVAANEDDPDTIYFIKPPAEV